jgi:hypothetical protein
VGLECDAGGEPERARLKRSPSGNERGDLGVDRGVVVDRPYMGGAVEQA